MEAKEAELENHIRKLSPDFDGALGEIQQFAYREGFPVISPEGARFLSGLMAVKRPEKVLEIGCCIGFSAGIISRFLPEGGHITTIDRYDIMIGHAKETFRKLNIEDRVTLMEGDAAEILPALQGEFDFIFMDAAKGQYMHFLPLCLRLLNVGGTLLADDIFQNGFVAMDRFSVPRRQRTIHSRMRKFLHTVTHTENLESCIIPIDDGMVLCTKLSDDISLGE